MSASSSRNKECETFHHLVSRIAHKVFFLKEDERNDFTERLRRVSIFTGIEPLGWCVMTNHFHILAYLPEPKELDEAEVLRRFEALKGAQARADFEKKLATLRLRRGGEADVQRELDAVKKRMYSIASFMKILKQWTTEDYNMRHSHTGTLWEAVYKDRTVKEDRDSLATVLAYIHLNPVRAGLCAGFAEYPWSSLTRFAQGDWMAKRGMALVYGEGMMDDEILAEHKARMADALEEMKRKWAVEVARRRAAGYIVPDDPLTDEAMVAQAAAHLSEVQKAGTELHEERRRGRPRKEGADAKILEELLANPAIGTKELAEKAGISERLAYERLKALKAAGLIEKEGRSGPWCTNCRK